MKKQKWRGIQTTQKVTNKLRAETIINRFGQKSISLPWINDKKRWAGFPGITGISRKIIKYIPSCLHYVEPFAGAAKVFQALQMSGKHKVKNFILNENSDYIYDWIKREFSGCQIGHIDFAVCMGLWDSKKTFFLIDPPWFKTYYDQFFSCFNRPSVKDYDNEIINICRKLKGTFIITTRKENKIMLNSGFNNYLLKSEYVVCGKYPQVLLTTNLKLRGLKRA